MLLLIKKQTMEEISDCLCVAPTKHLSENCFFSRVFTKLEISVVLNLFTYSLNLFKYLCNSREMTKANGESFEN